MADPEQLSPRMLESLLGEMEGTTKTAATGKAAASDQGRTREVHRDFFQGMVEQLTSTLHKEFVVRLESEIDRVRLAYAEAMQKEKEGFQEQLWQLAQHLKVPESQKTGEGCAESSSLPEHNLTKEQLQSFEEAAQLNIQVAELLSKRREFLDQPSVPYCKATAVTLKELVKRTETLQEYCNQRLAALTLDFAPKNLAGKAFPVQVQPAVDTVKTVKQRLRAEHDCQSCVVKLCVSQEQVMDMQDLELLMDYDLEQEVTLILVDSLVANPVVRLAFEDPASLAFDSVSGRSGSVDHPDQVVSITTSGRTGVNIQGRGCLVLPKPVALGEEWTISVWTLGPIDVGDHTYRDLVDSMNSQERIAVILARGRLGNYNSNSFIEGFNARDLTSGWHHIAVVGQTRCTTYYVDGQSLGTKRGRARGAIGVVGNSRGCNESWGYMSDFQIFGVAASDAQIKNIYEAGAPSTPDTNAEPWQVAVARCGRGKDHRVDRQAEFRLIFSQPE
ncbi:unnamed protein product [Durusdinium trenchii]|uniref:Ubiquitin-like domain-containing protein n=1 Tax=Durusdinium trenchii TaxID=1381693 RepID=A0ABP0K5T7_9DINO